MPEAMNYGEIIGLSAEVRQKLQRVRPATFGQAARIEGMTPAALAAILVHIKRRESRQSA